MPERVIIADSSCLIALSNIDELQILQGVYEQITITPEIESEFGEPLPDWIIVEEVTDKKKITILELELDKGESSAIALAIEKGNSLLIIDEKKGRNVAKKMGIKITGILGVAVKAKPGQWLRQRRLQHARLLQETTGRPISEIAHDSGFENASHFSQAFRAQFGHSPSEWRSIGNKGQAS